MSKSKNKGALAGICRVLPIILILLVVLAYLPLYVPGLLGYETFAIVSGSMEPTIPTGSLVFVKDALPDDLEPGDVISFRNDIGEGTVITHRLVEKQEENQCLITKGDANATNDLQPIPYGNLIGQVIASIPFLGFLTTFVASIQGKIVMVVILGIAVLMYIFHK
jgi:signal peptidase